MQVFNSDRFGEGKAPLSNFSGSCYRKTIRVTYENILLVQIKKNVLNTSESSSEEVSFLFGSSNRMNERTKTLATILHVF